MTTSGDRLKALLQECHLTPSDFAAQRGVTPQHINNWFRRGVPLARLDETADLFCVHRRWLHTGEGPKYPNAILRQRVASPDHVNPSASLLNHDGRMLHIPLHHVRGDRLQPEADIHLPLPAQALEIIGVMPEQAICLSMPAANMAPLIPMNAIVAIDRGRTEVVDGQAYALLHNGQLKVHSLSLGHHDTLCLHSHDRHSYAVERYTRAQRQAQGLEVLGWVFHWSYFSQRRPG
ncbi:HTH-type transcriptional regulator PrtR [Pseudomonas reidholzensis]|uniref:HTH-type transcriptional regulator PrtR n=1 Tax=Pseudomonas reidholzensis TaxID=1785162 RepID=A0A383RQB4_9PSED|nr:helix-turn-helix transcriptional regulator [Pseudomonas reidholzensis]SYX88538.1 HTH-type transcriptional regulator PrtR [Pseudomonas reidholzensis]